MRNPTEILIKLGFNFSEKKAWKTCSWFWVVIMNQKIKLFWEKQGKGNLFPVIFPSAISLITCYSHWSSAFLSHLQNELPLCVNLVMWCWVWAISVIDVTGQRTLVLWCSLSFHGAPTGSNFLLISVKFSDHIYFEWNQPTSSKYNKKISFELMCKR